MAPQAEAAAQLRAQCFVLRESVLGVAPHGPQKLPNLVQLGGQCGQSRVRCGKTAVLMSTGGQGRQPRKKIVREPLVRLLNCTIAEGAAELADGLGERRHRSQVFVVGGDILGRLLQDRDNVGKAVRSADAAVTATCADG